MNCALIIHVRIMLGFLIFGIGFVHAAYPKNMYVAVESLNVRDEPSTDAQIVFKLNRNSQIEVLDTLQTWGAFQHPDYPGNTFWVAMNYLSDEPISERQAAISAGEHENLPIWVFALGGLLVFFGGHWLLRIIGLILVLLWFA